MCLLTGLLIAGGAAAVGGIIKGASASKAARLQSKAADKANQIQQDMYNKSIELNMPWMQFGKEGLEMMKEGIESGAFDVDQSMFDGLKTYEYEGFQAPEYKTDFQQAQARQPETFTGEQISPEVYQGPQAPERQALTAEPYQGQPAPQARQIDPTSQVQAFQQQQAPQQFQAGQAPQAQYTGAPTTPGQAYRGEDFDVTKDPGYQMRLKEGIGAIEGSAAAKGMQLSGKTLKDITQYGQDLASQETEKAYGRFAAERGFEAGQEQEDYRRQQQQQGASREAMRYQSEDEYRRYLDSVGIKGAEADRATQQWESDRAFGANQNKDTWLREQAAKQFGRQLNQDEFGQWMQTEGQQFAQQADQRDWTTQQANFEADRARQAFESDRNYTTGRQDLQTARQIQERDYATGRADIGEERQRQAYESDRDYQARMEMLNRQGFLEDRQFGAQQQLLGQQAQQQAAGTQYNQAQDAYNRDLLAKTQQYGQTQDAIGVGQAALGATQALQQGAGTAGANTALQQGNIQANKTSTIGNIIGGGISQLGGVAGGLITSGFDPRQTARTPKFNPRKVGDYNTGNAGGYA